MEKSFRKPIPNDVHIREAGPTIVFVTVCTHQRGRWLATEENHRLLHSVWHDARAWLIGRYVILPDHLHLFAAPGEMELPLENWVTYWKKFFSIRHGVPEHRWLPNCWDTRLRSGESYDEKWEYVRNNPIRHGLVAQADEWPYQGELNSLDW